ncbi:hypothetical protein J9B83_12745 [Marinomonas sp. A79]|uniref:Biopolymer transport protein ExbD/TolR n=1 Tax=Marinomonas vulgaris TaxID=2823372 RepID=A0ABS5HE88_9GAMM|nr:hypothetical protein [Marinomonas vulgaris]MBR7889800.1 hypothetical protein [Marinomonas vulgaris]
MDDDTLAPFVDALASALIMMVLVAIFFLVQTATSLTASAKLATISDRNIDEEKPLFTPIIYRDVVEYDLEKNTLKYIVNFKLDDVHKDMIKSKMDGAKSLKITVRSNDDKKKSVVNMLSFLRAMSLPAGLDVKTEVLTSNSVLSSLTWEVTQ